MSGRTHESCLKVMGAILLAALFGAGLPSRLRAEEDRTAQIEKAFREGVDLYQQGQYSAAQLKFHEVLKLDPRKEIAARLVDEAGVRMMAKIMADTRMGTEPTRIWELYRKYYVSKLADKERTANLAKRLVNPATTEDERNLVYRELATLGQYAIPFLAPFLADKAHEDYHTYARIAITAMGSRAVLPVVALLDEKDQLLREHAVMILNDLRPSDPRAIPALKARLEDPREDATVKRYAAQTLKRITGQDPGTLKSAAAYYYDLANRYYLDRAGVADEGEEAGGLLWHLNAAGELLSVQYPLWAWNDQMAEDLCLRGLARNPEHTDFYPLWACIQGAQFTKVKDLLDVIAQPAINTFNAEEQQELKNWDAKLVNTRRLAGAVGLNYLNAALFKVHADLAKYPTHSRVPSVGVFLARELAVVDPSGTLLNAPPPPVLLVDASSAKGGKGQNTILEPPPPVVSTSALVIGMASPDQNIQYACALALAKINRFPADWIGHEKVAALLGRGVSEDKPLQILVVEENQNAANELRSRLEGLGYGVTLAQSARDGLVAAKMFPPKDIAIIADNLRRDLTTDQLLEELRADPRTRYMPSGILYASKDRDIVKARFGTEISLVERENAGNDLKVAVEAIAAKRAAQSVPKRQAHDVAVECASALSLLCPQCTLLALDDAIPNAIGALTNRPDDVRLPAAVFLGHTAGGKAAVKAAAALKAVFLDANNKVELRRTALKSLGLVQKEGLEDLYLKAQADPDQEIKDLAAEAFGEAPRADKTINEFIQSERIDKAKKTE